MHIEFDLGQHRSNDVDHMTWCCLEDWVLFSSTWIAANLIQWKMLTNGTTIMREMMTKRMVYITGVVHASHMTISSQGANKVKLIEIRVQNFKEIFHTFR